MTDYEYRRDRRNLVRECSVLAALDVTCRLSGEKVTAAELLMFALFGLEYLRSEAK